MKKDYEKEELPNELGVCTASTPDGDTIDLSNPETDVDDTRQHTAVPYSNLVPIFGPYEHSKR